MRRVAADAVIRPALLHRSIGQYYVVIADMVNLALESRRPLRMIVGMDLLKSVRIDGNAVDLPGSHGRMEHDPGRVRIE